MRQLGELVRMRDTQPEGGPFQRLLLDACDGSLSFQTGASARTTRGGQMPPPGFLFVINAPPWLSHKSIADKITDQN